jgi:hypothetical protein
MHPEAGDTDANVMLALRNISVLWRARRARNQRQLVVVALIAADLFGIQGSAQDKIET